MCGQMKSILWKLDAPAMLTTSRGWHDLGGRTINNNSKLPPINRPKCGTITGYSSHISHKENPCNPCLEACRLYSRKRYNANPEKAREQKRQSRSKNLERDKENYRRWYANNSDKKIRLANQWYENNWKRAQENKKSWRKSNIEKVRILSASFNRKRRANEKNNGSEPYTVQQVLDTYGTDCHICNKPIDLNAPRATNKKGYELGLHIDHLIPIIKGGSDTLRNVRPSHAKCNLKKNGRIL
jgi:HNH endonuclease